MTRKAINIYIIQVKLNNEWKDQKKKIEKQTCDTVYKKNV